tara:strand:- start:4498 stop:4755 length:258 start_codon:yes stop_codon:yes gene_type:complete
MPNNNKRLAQKRKRRHQERVNKHHLNMKLQRESILENTLEGQIIKDYNIPNLYNSENENNLLSSYDMMNDIPNIDDSKNSMCIIS